MQRIALDVADELVHGQGIVIRCIAPAQVDLVQMARAVEQVVQRPLGVRLAGQGRQHGLGAVAQRVVGMAQGVGLAGLLISGDFLDEVAHAVIGKVGGVQQFEDEIGLTSACFPGFLLWF